ncbi:MAG: hypothetical protein GY719_22890 [bacterium]|nr:hypothetical protein [bacterium]
MASATRSSHVNEVVAKRLQLQVRNGSVTEVFGILSGIRDVVTGAYGETTRVELFGSVSALPQAPLGLHRLGVRVHGQMLDAGFRLPKVLLVGFPPLEREKVAAGLKKPLDRLGTAVASLSLESKDADVTLLDKNAGVEEFRRTLRFAAGTLAGLYGLAGFDDLAARIRPKRRASRRGGGGPDGGGGQSAGADESAGSTDSESPEQDEDASGPAGGDADATADGASGPIGIVR